MLWIVNAKKKEKKKKEPTKCWCDADIISLTK